MAPEKELRELGDGCFAYLQGRGGWGWSNAGLLVGDGQSLLVDTLFDLHLTHSMLETMAPITGAAPIITLVNTHANGDHWFGNELVTGAEIVASTAAAGEMLEVPPAVLGALINDPGELGDLFRPFFGAFDFDGITPTTPTRTFDDRLELDVGGKPVELIEVGPAHTKGDVIVVSPADRTVFTGDILFIGTTPIAWVGPVSNWIRACDLIGGLDVDTVVPGHGPVTDKTGVVQVRDYLAFVDAEARARHDAGMTAAAAANDIALGEFADWGEFGRVAVTVEAIYRELEPDGERADIVELFRRMAAIEEGASHG